VTSPLRSCARLAAWTIGVSGLIALAACGGPSSVQSVPGASTPGRGTQAFSVVLPVNVAPPKGRTSATRAPLYFSPNTQSLKLWVYQAGAHGTIQVTTATLSPLSPSSNTCTTNSSGTVCNIPLSLSPGTYYCTVEVFADLQGHGRILSIQEYIPLTVSSNGTVTTPPWTLWGVPATISATPTANAMVRSSGTVATTYDRTVQYTITANDQSGAQLVGPGMPTWAVAGSNAKFTVVQPTTQSPNTFTVSTTSTAPLTTKLTITGSFPGSAIDFCRVVGANCTSPALTLNSIDAAADDWVTFAHDYQRTGNEQQSTGISVSTAPQLALRWKVQVPNKAAINANPTVVDGNVIVVTSNPVGVYDFSAIDGSLLWSQTSIPGGSIKPATIDAGAGLVFVGNRLSNSSGALPSTLYALSLADGHIVWQSTLMGETRSAEVVANGKIYIASAGGDPPACKNMGVQAVDEATGNLDWTWILNKNTNPGGGGAVWGAIGYDGAHLIFGTGNVCQASGNGSGVVTTADGAAALDLSGNLLWSYVAWAQTGPNAMSLDYDTGSSVMVQNSGLSTETASFLNKNGILYTFNTSGLSSATPSAVLQRSTIANQYTGYGFFGSPTSDGTVTVVGSGEYGDSWSGVTAVGRETQQVVRPSPLTPDHFTPKGLVRPSSTVSGYYELVRGFDASGNRLWSYKMTNILEGYVALNDGVALLGSDSSVVALNMHGSGALTPLWSYPTTGVVDNSPAVVPSGIYVGDNSGWVYAFTPPPAGS